MQGCEEGTSDEGATSSYGKAEPGRRRILTIYDWCNSLRLNLYQAPSHSLPNDRNSVQSSSRITKPCSLTRKRTSRLANLGNLADNFFGSGYIHLRICIIHSWHLDAAGMGDSETRNVIERIGCRISALLIHHLSLAKSEEHARVTFGPALYI